MNETFATNLNLTSATVSGPPSCRRCKHMRRVWWHRLLGIWTFAYCVKPEVDKHPELLDVPNYCSVERNPDFDDITKCGSTGKLFEPRNG